MGRKVLYLPIIVLLAFLFLPLLAIFFNENPMQLIQKIYSPLSYQALMLSLKTSLIALIAIIVLGTPLAYCLAKFEFPAKRTLEVALQMPIVAPPAVAGVGLLLVFGQKGWFGGMSIAFSAAAVIMAQIFMSAPFFVTAARQSFEAVDDQLISVSRTLGIAPWKTFWRVTFPLALPGLLTGIALSWARALGEFGATMMFAGNLPGKTQTLPLAIYTAMESDFSIAVAISALLLLVAFALLLAVSFIGKRKEAY
ncbi:ABC transporter permease [Neobacillus muris]|uniref:ABC transporter permease n=1 Tax=Neobacillus muris TaxID=2941334 RepID=UPI002040B92D|nr:ABC transporter permease [Neobacillus muris]